MRRVLLPLILLASLIALAVSLRPSMQRQLVLDHAPAAWALHLDEFALLPWSLSARGIAFSLDGVHYRIGKLDARFNPLTLVTDTLTVYSLSLQHTEVDARAPGAGGGDDGFPGLLALLNQGLALRLDRLDANLGVSLPGGRSLSFHATGGPLKPHVAGSLPFSLEYREDGPGPDQSRAPGMDGITGSRLVANGALEVSQLRQGRLRHLTLSAKGSMTTSATELPERFDVMLKVAPPPGNLANPYRRRQALVNGKQVALPNPEALSLEAFLVGESGETRASLAMAGLYRGDIGLLSTTWTFSATEALVSPYLAAETPLSDLQLEAGGALQWSLPDARGRVNLEQAGALKLSPGAPALRVASGAQASLEAGNLTLHSARLEAGAEGEQRPALRATLVQPVVIPLRTPGRVLEHARDLASIDLGPFPLSALDGVLPGITLGGELSGRSALRVEDSGQLVLSALEPARVQEARIAHTQEVWLSEATLTAKPGLRWSPDRLRLNLDELSMDVAGATALSMSLAVERALVKAESPWRVRARGELAPGALAALPGLRQALPATAVPAALELAFDGRLELAPRGEISLQSLTLEARTPAQAGLLTLATRTSFPLTPLLHPDGSGALRMPVGDLLHVGLNALPLAWLDPWLAHQSLDGRVLKAGFTLAAEPEGVLKLRPDAVLSVGGFSLRDSGRLRLSDLSLETSPLLKRDGNDWSLALSDLKLSARGQTLVSGAFEASVQRSPGAAMSWVLGSEADIDFGRLVHQPLLAEALPDDLPVLPLSGRVNLAVAGQGGDFTVQRGEAALRLGPKARFELHATPGLEIRSRLQAGENLARHAVGTLALEVSDLPSSSLSDFLSLGQLRFKEVNAQLRLVSDGRVLKVDSATPLRLEAVRLLENQRALTAPFDLSVKASLEATRRRLNLVLDEAALHFSGSAEPALGGRLLVGLTPGARVPLTTLEAELRLNLPQILAQPALLPGHRLTRGTASLRARVAADRTLSANLALAELDAGRALALNRLELPLEGVLASDGRGFDFSAPVLATGKSGPTRAVLRGHYAPQPDEPRVITLGLAGEVFYLNDLLAAWTAIAPASSSARTVGAKPRQAVTRIPDAKAAWKLIPPALVIDVAIDRLFYSDYLAFDTVLGKLDLRSRRFGLQQVAARFHESEISFDGVMRFKAGAPEPYSLEMKGRIRDFDLNTFFTELVPGEKPRVEGLFGVKVEATGVFPNFSQLRNRLLFDVRMKSRNGLFRPLPPDSALMLGASDFMGTLGEGLSYLPTGGFGAGAVARLVNYIAEIDYDTLDLHLLREDSRHVQLEEFQLLSPTIALTATGGIHHDPGEDILDSPLELTAELDMLGRGAAILYSLDLMRDEKDTWGYWRGPSFRIWGSLAEPESNFDEIVNAAGDAAVQGAFTHPLSGLVGNLKFRWFDDKSAARERAREERRARDLRREQEESVKAGAGPPATSGLRGQEDEARGAVSPAP